MPPDNITVTLVNKMTGPRPDHGLINHGSDPGHGPGPYPEPGHHNDGPVIVRTEEIVIVMIVMLIWLYSCVLFYLRWRKFSHLEPSHTYLPSSPVLQHQSSRLSSLVSVSGTRSRNNSLSTLGLMGVGTSVDIDRKYSLAFRNNSLISATGDKNQIASDRKNSSFSIRNVQSCDKPISGGGVLPITRQSTFTLLDSKQNIINGSPEQRINNGRRQSDHQLINVDSNSNQKFSLPKVTEKLLNQNRRKSCDTALIEMREGRNATLLR